MVIHGDGHLELKKNTRVFFRDSSAFVSEHVQIAFLKKPAFCSCVYFTNALALQILYSLWGGIKRQFLWATYSSLAHMSSTDTEQNWKACRSGPRVHVGCSAEWSWPGGGTPIIRCTWACAARQDAFFELPALAQGVFFELSVTLGVFLGHPIWHVFCWFLRPLSAEFSQVLLVSEQIASKFHKQIIKNLIKRPYIGTGCLFSHKANCDRVMNYQELSRIISRYGTKRDFQIQMAAIFKWPKIGSPTYFYLMASTFDIERGLMSANKLGLRLSWVEAAQ